MNDKVETALYRAVQKTFEKLGPNAFRKLSWFPSNGDLR